MKSVSLIAAIILCLSVFFFTPAQPVSAAEYVRQAQAAPQPEDIGEDYVLPPLQRLPARAVWWNAADVAALVTAMSLSAYLVLKRRSRKLTVLLTVASLLYFGFYRQGCVCAVGAVQNVAVALTDSGYAISFVAIGFFFLPLLFALLFGRVFCGGACPLGAIQELVLLKPVNVPRKLDRVLGLFKYLFLAAAVWYAIKPASERDFIICRFDPFVGFFRLTGPGDILIFGGLLLILSVFVGRTYCRYLCPYGALLAIVSRLCWWGVKVTPDKELDCGLCGESCPYGAIENMRVSNSSCFYCARCFASCPREPENWPQGYAGEQSGGANE